ncbi:MAG: UDP-N-acetylmuramoyl-L-alanine--D-glutamate ligase [bacterium]
MDFKGKKIIVMGLGILGGGVAVVKWLAKKGAELTVTDLKNKKELKNSITKLKDLKIKYVLGRHREDDFKKADLIIQNPAVPADSEYLKIARESAVPIENEASLFFKIVPQDLIIGITGTRGKSTTTTLIYQIFKKKYQSALCGGNIKVNPLFEIIEQVKKDPVVLELSSFQLENLADSKISPHLSIITNILPDHLNRYKNLKNYINAKANIFNFQSKEDFVVLNLDNPLTKKLGQDVPSRRYWFSEKYFSQQNGVFLSSGRLIFRQNGQEIKVLNVKEIKLPGSHNLENILAAVAAAMIYQIPVKLIRKAVSEFKGVPGRLELIKVIKGIKFYNDTTATIPEATIAALVTLGQLKDENLRRRRISAKGGWASGALLGRKKSKVRNKNIVLIAGGADKKLDFHFLAPQIKKYCKTVILLPGTATPKIYKELRITNYELRIINVKNMIEAVAVAFKLAVSSDIILLSPAAASFGLFKNEFDRGEQYLKAVKKLKS